MLRGAIEYVSDKGKESFMSLTDEGKFRSALPLAEALEFFNVQMEELMGYLKPGLPDIALTSLERAWFDGEIKEQGSNPIYDPVQESGTTASTRALFSLLILQYALIETILLKRYADETVSGEAKALTQRQHVILLLSWIRAEGSLKECGIQLTDELSSTNHVDDAFANGLRTLRGIDASMGQSHNRRAQPEDIDPNYPLLIPIKEEDRRTIDSYDGKERKIVEAARDAMRRIVDHRKGQESDDEWRTRQIRAAIWAARKEAGKTQAEIAQGWSYPSTISSLELGNHRLTPKHISMIAQNLGIDMKELAPLA